MFSAILAGLTFLIGIFFGIFYLKLLSVLSILKQVLKKVEEPPKQSHVTIPSYSAPTNKQTAQVITPKSPQQLTYELQQRQMQEMMTKR